MATVDHVFASTSVFAASVTRWPDSSWSCLTAWATDRTAAEVASLRWKALMQGSVGDVDGTAVSGADVVDVDAMVIRR
jgi:hypothetical protein